VTQGHLRNMTSFSSSPVTSGDLVSDAGNKLAAVFIFRMPSSFSTTQDMHVVSANFEMAQTRTASIGALALPQPSPSIQSLQAKSSRAQASPLQLDVLTTAGMMIMDVLLPLLGQLSHSDLHIFQQPKKKLQVYVQSVCDGPLHHSELH